ncbi:ammonium transporter [bacterium]|nr:ammonium transporter [bacterium]
MDNELSALNVLFTEFYYWVCIVLMFLIHVGFCLYEVGVSRRKNMMHTLMKNTMLIPLITVTFYFFGWWIYFAFQNGPGITGGLNPAPWAQPWNELMGTHMGGRPHSGALTAKDTAAWARLNGVFWGAFLIFSCTAGSILSGAVIERIRSSAFWLFAVMVGSVTWVIDAAWGWSADGWMVQKLGYHDAYASGVIHAISGGSALAILYHLGPRIGRFRPDGTPRNFPPHNTWLTIIGLFLIYTGFWGFYAACNIPIFDVDPSAGRSFFSATTIYLTPTTLSAITLNFLMSLAGGLIAGYFVSKGDPYWTFSGGLAGIITASAGNDLYHPLQAHLIGAFGVLCLYKLHYWVERRFKIDDAVGAVAVHGYAGVIGVVIAGLVLWGYPASPNANYARITPWGQLIGALIMFFGLGFLPCFLVASLLKRFRLLRIPEQIELAGMDHRIREMEAEEANEIVRAELKAAQRSDKRETAS